MREEEQEEEEVSGRGTSVSGCSPKFTHKNNGAAEGRVWAREGLHIHFRCDCHASEWARVLCVCASSSSLPLPLPRRGKVSTKVRPDEGRKQGPQRDLVVPWSSNPAVSGGKA